MCFPSRPSGLTNSHTHRRINSHTHSYVCKCTFNRTQTDINTQYALKHTVLFLINLLHNYKMFKEKCKHLTLSTGRKHFFCFTMCILKLTNEGILKRISFYNTYMFRSSTAACVFLNPLSFTFLLPASSLPCTSLRLSLSTPLSLVCFCIFI